MITKNELRIGNYLESDGRDIIITGHYLSNLEKGMKPDNPIPITEEWLKNFGFEIRQEGWYLYAIQSGIVLNISYISEYTILNGFSGKPVIKKYFHEIQNLYFALTGKELTLSVT